MSLSPDPYRSTTGGETANRRVSPLASGSAHLVPMQYVGEGRELRRRLAEAHGLWKPAADKLLEPFRPRPGFTPMPRRARLVRLGHEFGALPSFGRLRILVRCGVAGLQIAEVRAVPSRIRLHDWGDDSEREPGISIVLLTVGIAPPRFGEAKTTMVVIGLHALGRRFERARGDDAGVLRDLLALMQAYPAVARTAGEFKTPVEGGHWRGIVLARAEAPPVMAVRTFVGENERTA